MNRSLYTALLLLGFLLVTGCDGGSDAPAETEEATFDTATFNKSTWK